MMKLKKYIDPKNPGKTSEFNKMPKYYQMGTFVDGGDDGGALTRIPRGKRDKSLVDSFLKYDIV